MAKPRLFLATLLRLLKESPATSPEVNKITKKSRKVVIQYLKIGQQENLIKKDGFGKYHLTQLGQARINNVHKPLDSAKFEVNSEVLYTPEYQPTANCTLLIKNAKKMLALDMDAHEYQMVLMLGGGYGTIENSTNLPASAGALVSAILDLKAREIGLLSTLRSEFADKFNPFDYEMWP